jgi:hypothetical protein
MKKITAILLLAIFAFNLFGYKLWSYFAAQNATLQLTQALDNKQYNDEDLVLVTKAINLPYYNNTDEFTSAEGETEINGVYYRYVKYRINNNQLQMLCLPDNQKTKIRDAKNNYFSITADVEKKGDNKNMPSKSNAKSSISDFEENTAYTFNAHKANTITSFAHYKNATAVFLSKEVAEQPPDFFA